LGGPSISDLPGTKPDGATVARSRSGLGAWRAAPSGDRARPAAATEVDGPPPSRDAELVQEPAGLGGQELRLVPHALELGRAVPQVVVVG
jgi:hypothetical protein